MKSVVVGFASTKSTANISGGKHEKYFCSKNQAPCFQRCCRFHNGISDSSYARNGCSNRKIPLHVIVVFEDQTGAKYHMNIIKVDSKGSKIEVSYGNRRAGEEELFECHTSLIEFLSAYKNGLVGNNITNDNLDYSKLFNGMNVSISAVYSLPTYLVEGGWNTGWKFTECFQ